MAPVKYGIILRLCFKFKNCNLTNIKMTEK